MLVATLGSGTAAAGDPEKTVLVLPFELVDTSLQGELEGPSRMDRDRVRAITGYVEDMLEESERYRVLDRAPVAGLLKGFDDTYAYTFRCKSCAVRAARKIDADLVISGWVQKVSNLIRNLTIRVQDARTGKVVAGGWTSLRGNTEEMLERAAFRVVTDNILERHASGTPAQHGKGQD